MSASGSGRGRKRKNVAGNRTDPGWEHGIEIDAATKKLEMAEECLLHGMDLSGLLLLYSSLGDTEGISKLASLAEEQGKNNVAFLCLFMLGKLEECLRLLLESNRIPEAALMARSYLPSKVSQIAAIWRNDLSKVNKNAAESLADPGEYPNMFDDWQIALAIESKLAETRGTYPPAEQYLTYAEKSKVNLLENFKSMHIDYEEAQLENGGSDHQELLENGEDGGEEEPVEVDADSTNGTVLVNGHEGEEEDVLAPHH